MTNAEKLDWLYRLKSEIYVYMPKEWLIPMEDALDEAIKALSEPTIPLSVIEKIHDAIDNADSDDFYEDEHGYIIDSTLTIEHIHEIIDKAVKECTHEKG